MAMRPPGYMGMNSFLISSTVEKTMLIICFYLLPTLIFYVEASDPQRSFDDQHAAMLGRVEASIMAESALIDRETGRVFWEGGSSSTLYESMAPKFDQYGAEHAKAVVLTFFITLSFLGVLTGWLRHAVVDQSELRATSNSLLLSFLFTSLKWTLFRFPRIENKWLIFASVALYFLESYNCSTRRFLANSISGPTEVEEYIERLRREQPVVTWTVKSFHYERRMLFNLVSFFRILLIKSNQDAVLEGAAPRSKNVAPIFPFTKKVITNKATTTYQYSSCRDSTIAGMWKRAESASPRAAPFTKIALTKILVLSEPKSREDYFRQQSEFVTENGRGDEFVEFSTDIEVSGYRPRMLAVRSIEGVSSAKLFRLHLFWLFTCFGMTVPFRIWFKRHSDFLRVTVVKETAVCESSSKWTAASRWLSPRANSSDCNNNFESFMQNQSLYRKENTPELNIEHHANIKDSKSPVTESLTNDGTPKEY